MAPNLRRGRHGGVRLAATLDLDAYAAAVARNPYLQVTLNTNT